MLKNFRQFLDRLKYPQKFGLISLLFIVPLVSFLPIVQELNANIDQYGRKELAGTLYLRPLEQILYDVQDHELAVEASLEKVPAKDDVATVEARLNTDFALLQSVQQNYGATLGLTTEPGVLSTQWQDLKNATPAIGLQDSTVKHDQMIKAVQSMISLVGDRSSLILDPNLDTYYMMDTVLLKLPRIQVELADVYLQAEKAVDHPQTFTAADHTELVVLVGNVRSDLAQMQQNMDVALVNNTVARGGNAPGQMTLLVKAQQAADILASNNFLDLIDTRIISATSMTVMHSDYVALADKAFAANSGLYDGASQALAVGIQARIDRQTGELTFPLTVALSSILLAYAVGVLLMISISRPLSELNLATQQLAAGDLSVHVPVTTGDEVGQVGIAFNNMTDRLKQTLQGLEQRGVELNRRTAQLEAAALVARAAAEVRDLKELLNNVVEQITQRFNFYHAGIFLTDVNDQFVVLEAASSEGGKRMIDRGHRLEIGRQGIVGFAADQKRPRIAQDVGDDAVFFNNPDLPETHSEVALPLLAQNQLIGILDIQSLERNAFSTEDIHTLQSMADQIALAIENARLIDDSRAAIEELQMLTSESTFQLWKERLGRQNKAYSYSSLGISPVAKTQDTAGNNGSDAGDEHTIKFPIALRGQKIGVLSLKRKPSESVWTDAEKEMASKIALQIALAIENARLLEESQRRAEKESAISEITSKIRRTNDPNEMIRVAISELKQALNIKDVRIVPYNPPKNGNGKKEE